MKTLSLNWQSSYDLARIFIFIVFIFSTHFGHAQTTFDYELTTTNVHETTPFLTGGEYLATDYSTIIKPLVAEAFATNTQIGVSSADVHAPAAGKSSVYFGGDLPTPNGYGTAASTIFTKQVFDRSDLPLKLQCEFFSRQNIPAYNEHYFFLIPKDYQYYQSPTYYVNSELVQKEGLNFGGRPFQSWASDHYSTTQASSRISNVTHNVSSNGQWYTMEVYLDELNGNFFVRDMSVNGQGVFANETDMGAISYLNNYRLGIAVDDMASSFVVVTNYKGLSSGFSAVDTICAGECVDFENQSESYIDNASMNYSWTFPGALVTTSNVSAPTNICYPDPGVYQARLIVYNDFEQDTFSKEITVLPNPIIELGNDTVICNSGIVLDAFYPNATYHWSDNSKESSLTVDSAGKYLVRVNIGKCTYTDSINIEIKAGFTIDLGPDTSFCLGVPFIIGGNLPLDMEYTWHDNSKSQLFQTTESGLYHVLVSDGCSSARDSIRVTYGECQNFIMHIPNAFSPNSDDHNPTFRPFIVEGECCVVNNYQLQVFNRWGELVFETYNIENGWDGVFQNKDSQQDVYAWLISYRYGRTKVTEKGQVHLVK